jgi:hypothetical protein
MNLFQPVLDGVLHFDCKEIRKSPENERRNIGECILASLDGFLGEDGGGAKLVPQHEVVYGLRIAAEYGGNNGRILEKVTEIAQRYNSGICDRGNHINGVHLFDNNKRVGYHRIPNQEM